MSAKSIARTLVFFAITFSSVLFASAEDRPCLSVLFVKRRRICNNFRLGGAWLAGRSIDPEELYVQRAVLPDVMSLVAIGVDIRYAQTLDRQTDAYQTQIIEVSEELRQICKRNENDRYRCTLSLGGNAAPTIAKADERGLLNSISSIAEAALDERRQTTLSSVDFPKKVADMIEKIEVVCKLHDYPCPEPYSKKRKWFWLF